jgi:hypothetical protein
MRIRGLLKRFFIYDSNSILSYYFSKDNKKNIINKSKNTFLVNLRNDPLNRSLNSSDLFFKKWEIEIQLLNRPLTYSRMPNLILNYSPYLFRLKSSLPYLMEKKEWEYELKKIEDKKLKDFTQNDLNFKKAFNIESINEFKSFIYTSRTNIRNLKIEGKRKIILNKLVNREKVGLSTNLINPHYYLPPHYNRKSKLGQLRNWKTSIYTFVRSNKRMNLHLDLYASKLIKSFFSVKSIFTWLRYREEVENAIIIKTWFNRRNNIMFLYAYMLFRFPTKIKRVISKVLKERWKLNEVEYYKFMLVQPIASIFGLNFGLTEENYLKKKRRWMISKPLFKHTSFNVIIDLFIFNNKSYRENILHNLIARRTMYKYMYSMYANFANKIKATFSRPRFFYINILEPGTYIYYHKVIRNYEKTIIFKNGIFKLYLYYFLIQMKFSAWKKNILRKDEINDLSKNKNDSNNISTYLNVDYKKENNKIPLIKIKNIVKNEVQDRTSLLVEKYSALLINEKEEILNVYDTDNQWVQAEDDKNTLVKRKAAIGSWWEAEKAKQERLAQKAKADELLYKKYWNKTFKLDKITEENKIYLEEDSVSNLKKKGQKRRKQDEYLIWLEKCQEEKQKEKYNKLNKITPRISVNKEILDISNISISFEEIEKEYYKQHPEEMNNNVNKRKNENFIKKEFLQESEKTGKLIKEEEQEPSEFWNFSLFNISMIHDLTKKDFLRKYNINKGIVLNDKNSLIPSVVNTFTDFSKFPLESYQNKNNLTSKESINILEKKINCLNNSFQEKLLNEVNISKNLRNSLKKNYPDFVVKSVEREISYSSFLKNNLDKNDNLKNLWEKRDSKFFNVLDLYLKNIYKLEFKEKNKNLNKIFYSFYDDTKLFRGYGNFWYWLYFSAYVKREFYLINRDILLPRALNILPRSENTVIRKFFPDLDIPYNHNIESNYGRDFARFWPSYNLDDEDNKNDNSLFYNSEIFKPYYRYMIPLLVLKSFVDLCLRVKDYSLGFVENLFLWDNKGIENRAVIVSHFILVKILLDLLRYNYRSLIRLKPKYYYLNRIRRVKQKYTRASLNHWISNNRTLAIGRKSSKLFWHRFEKLISHYYSHVVRSAELDTRRKIFVPFVLYFEDILFIIYGKWVLIRLWPLKRFFLSSYILANRVLMLILWKTRRQKQVMTFTRRALSLMHIFKVKEIKSYYNHYIKKNNTWPTFILDKLNKDAKKGSLNFSGLENYYIDWAMSDRLSTYTRINNYLHLHFSPLSYKYSRIVKNSLNIPAIGINKYKMWELVKTLQWSSKKWIPNYEELSFYWLRPFNYYLMRLRTQFDISGIRFKLAGKVRHARTNDRSTYQHIYSGNFFGPRHTHQLYHKKIPLNVYHIKGHLKSYIDYARSDSKTDGGAVSLKIWLYARFSADIQELLLHLMEIKQLYNYLRNKSYKVDNRLKDIKYFSYESELLGSTDKYHIVKIKHEFIVKGKFREVTIPLIVLKELRNNSNWRVKKRRRSTFYK